MTMIDLDTVFYVSSIKDKLLKNTPKYFESHYFNDWVTITLNRTDFGHSENIPICHAADGNML